jgi:hypothetical protein
MIIYIFYNQKMAHSVRFVNNTDYTKYLSTWVYYEQGINKYTEIAIDPGVEAVITSATGEWDINDYFYDDNISKFHNCGYKRCEYIGKFRTVPCVQGKFSWIEHDKYDIIYDGKFTLNKI